MTLNTKDQLGFSQQLLSLLNAGLPLLGAIEIIASSAQNAGIHGSIACNLNLKKEIAFPKV